MVNTIPRSGQNPKVLTRRQEVTCYLITIGVPFSRPRGAGAAGVTPVRRTRQLPHPKPSASGSVSMTRSRNLRSAIRRCYNLPVLSPALQSGTNIEVNAIRPFFRLLVIRRFQHATLRDTIAPWRPNVARHASLPSICLSPCLAP
jgi:hypothetical protein